MSFGTPLALLGLLAVPLAVAVWLLAERRRMRYAVAFPNLDVLASVVARRSAWRRVLPAALALLALTVVAIGAARPRVTVQGTRAQGTVILLVDVSRSMVARDIKPSRLGAARTAIRAFLDRIPPRFAVGIVAFSTVPSVVSPVTTDRTVTRGAIDYLLPESGTAIGDGLARAVQVGQAAERAQGARAARGDRPPISILMLSDGAQRSGLLQPEQGAQRARAAGFRVYTIALGTPGGTVDFGVGQLGPGIPVPPDPATLRRISTITGGEFFAAPSAAALQVAYRKLGARVSSGPTRVEATAAFVAAGAGLLLVAGVLSAAWSSRLP